MEYNKIEQACLKYYNKSYNSFINKVPYSIFIHDFLDNLVTLLNIDRLAFISQYDRYTDSLYNINSIETDIYKSDNLKRTFDLDTSNTLIKESIESKNTVVNENIMNEDYNQCRINTIIIPILFGNSVEGIIGFLTTNSIDRPIIEGTKTLSPLLGTLLYAFNSKIRDSKPSCSNESFLVCQLLGDITNLIKNGIIILDDEYNISYYNNQIDSIFREVLPNKKKNDIIGKYIADIIPVFHSVVCDSKKQFFKNKEVEFQKGYFDLKAIINTIVMGDKVSHVIITEENKKTQTVESPTTVRSNKNLIAYLSHELRNPIQAITNGCYVLKTEIDYLKKQGIMELEDSEDVISNVTRNCKDMGVIIDDILDLSKIDAKEFFVNLEVCQISELVDTIIMDFHDTANEKGLKLLANINKSVPKTLYTDETRVYQILSNLISNSIKYSDTGNVILDVEYNEKEHGINFKISDEGKGIRRTEMCNLFKDFGQTSNSFNSKSTGLGLCVSQKIAHVLGGNISVTTQYKKGSTFTLFHPIKLGASGNKIKENKEIEPIKGRILIVDDEVHNASIFKMVLLSFNYNRGYNLTVELVFSGESAIDIIENDNVYDLIFMDIDMTGIDGSTTCRLLRDKYNYKNTIIAMTGNIMAKESNCEKDDEYKFKAFDKVLIKPFQSNVILNTLNEYLKKD